MALQDLLRTKLNEYADTDAGWRQFVLDHRDELKANADLNLPTPELMSIVAGNPERYLRTISPARPISVAWMLYLINDFHCPQEFVGQTVVYVPNLSYIDGLYQRYRTTQPRV